MKAVRRRDTPAELALRRILHKRGLRYKVDSPPLESLRRRADLVFVRAKVAVFVDGCFWHGCPHHMTWPRANAKWWRQKITKTMERDFDTDQKLTACGWTSIRILKRQPIEWREC